MNQATPRHLLHVFSTFAIGGPQVRTCEIINHFGQRYRHTIIALDGNHKCQEKLARTTNVQFRELPIEKGNLLKCLQQFREVLKTLHPDLLLTYNFGSVEWGMANSFFPLCSQIHHEDGFGPEEQDRQLPRRVLVRRAFLRKISRLVVPSRQLENIARDVWRFDSRVVTYIPNGVDWQRYQRETPLSGEPQQKELVLGTVATLRREKNIPRLIRVFLRLLGKPEIQQLNPRLIIAGDGPEAASIKRIVAENNPQGRIELTGYVADPAVIFRRFDIFAITSDTEQMPLSVLEAMAAGCPVAGMNVGDVADMVSAENQAFISPAGDESHLEQVLERLMLDSALRKKLGRENEISCRERFDKQAMFTAYERLYDLKL